MFQLTNTGSLVASFVALVVGVSAIVAAAILSIVGIHTAFAFGFVVGAFWTILILALLVNFAEDVEPPEEQVLD